MTTITDLPPFDAADRLNEDGTVTLKIIPSNWRAYNISPDTYQLVNGDSWCNSQQEYFQNEMSDEDFQDQFGTSKAGVTLEYDDFNWSYDHKQIVRDFAEVLCDWIVGELWNEIGSSPQRELIWDEEKGEHYWSEDFGALEGTVVDSWSPAYYNFVSDGFEMELTVHPETLRRLTPEFDAYEWVQQHYRSCDGFLSFVESRINDPEWHAQYDGEFRIEYLFAKMLDPYGERPWMMDLFEAEWEVYTNNVTIEVDVDHIRERQLYMDSDYTLAELEEWAAEIEDANRAGMDPLFD
jgi:hypothetical protein